MRSEIVLYIIQNCFWTKLESDLYGAHDVLESINGREWIGWIHLSKRRSKYPERARYFGFRKSDRIRYFKFKTRCPNCGKVCVEDFLAERVEKMKRAALLNCHRCGHASEDVLIWRRVVE